MHVYDTPAICLHTIERLTICPPFVFLFLLFRVHVWRLELTSHLSPLTIFTLYLYNTCNDLVLSFYKKRVV